MGTEPLRKVSTLTESGVISLLVILSLVGLGFDGLLPRRRWSTLTSIDLVSVDIEDRSATQGLFQLCL
jgi:hypothetical protein